MDNTLTKQDKIDSVAKGVTQNIKRPSYIMIEDILQQAYLYTYTMLDGYDGEINWRLVYRRVFGRMINWIDKEIFAAKKLNPVQNDIIFDQQQD